MSPLRVPALRWTELIKRLLFEKIKIKTVELSDWNYIKFAEYFQHASGKRRCDFLKTQVNLLK